MTKVIAYTRSDGGTSVCNPAIGARLIAIVVTSQNNLGVETHEEIVMPLDRARVLVGRPDGPNFHIIGEETEADWLARIRAKDVPADATNVTIMDASDIPEDRTFRNALEIVKGKFRHNMPKAREIHRASLRQARKPLLEALDIEYQRADEQGHAKAKASCAARKQKLRDVTADPRIAAAKTTEELKSVWPLE